MILELEPDSNEISSGYATQRYYAARSATPRTTVDQELQRDRVLNGPVEPILCLAEIVQVGDRAGARLSEEASPASDLVSL